MDFNQYLGKTVRVELDEGKAISGVCSKVTEAAKVLYMKIQYLLL